MKNTCEIGSVERMRLTAADITDLKNLSIVQVLDTYQKEADNLKEGIKEIEDTEEQAIYQKELSELERLIANIKLKQKYRTITLILLRWLYQVKKNFSTKMASLNCVQKNSVQISIVSKRINTV